MTNLNLFDVTELRGPLLLTLKFLIIHSRWGNLFFSLFDCIFVESFTEHLLGLLITCPTNSEGYLINVVILPLGTASLPQSNALCIPDD